MENKPLSQEKRISDFKNRMADTYIMSGSKKSFFEVLQEAIQFGSELRAERAKEKIGDHLACGMGIPELDDFNRGLATGLQAIDESGI